MVVIQIYILTVLVLTLKRKSKRKDINVFGKRAPQASERRTPPTLRTSLSIHLNNVKVLHIGINRVD
jgi:hypothetical protein